MRKKNSSKYEYLVCSCNSGVYNDCENKKGIRYDMLSFIVLSEINKLIKRFYDGEEIKSLSFDKVNNRFKSRINVLEIELINIENKISKTKNYLKNIYEDKVNGVISTEQFKDLIENYNKDEEIYKKQIKSITEKIEYYKKKDKSLCDDKEIFNKFQELSKLNRVIIEEFIDKIYIGKLNVKTKSRDIQNKLNF